MLAGKLQKSPSQTCWVSEPSFWYFLCFNSNVHFLLSCLHLSYMVTTEAKFSFVFFRSRCQQDPQKSQEIVSQFGKITYFCSNPQYNDFTALSWHSAIFMLLVLSILLEKTQNLPAHFIFMSLYPKAFLQPILLLHVPFFFY